MQSVFLVDVEVLPGIEPGNKGFADLGLTAWLQHHPMGCIRAWDAARKRLSDYAAFNHQAVRVGVFAVGFTQGGFIQLFHIGDQHAVGADHA